MRRKLNNKDNFNETWHFFGNLTKMDTKHREEKGTLLRYMLLSQGENSPNGKMQIQPSMTHNSLW